MPAKNPRGGSGPDQPWNLKDIEKLIDLLTERQIEEFEMEKDGLRVHIRRGAPPFVKVGDVIEAGRVLCIIEAMKLMNEIESEAAGEIVRVFVENGQPVEYGQPLFAVKPSEHK